MWCQYLRLNIYLIHYKRIPVNLFSDSLTQKIMLIESTFAIHKKKCSDLAVGKVAPYGNGYEKRKNNTRKFV